MFEGSAPKILAAAAAALLLPAVGAAKGSDAEAAIDSFIKMQAIDKSRPTWKLGLPKPIQADFSGSKVTWKLQTSLGEIAIRLMPEVAPQHVTSTVYLTKLGFYDDTLFHRVIPGFMAQGGDPLGRGSGGPGYEYDGEFDPKVKHDKPGILSMANRGRGTDGSQFFLTFKATPWLDGKHTIFGEVVSGLEVLEEFEKRGSRGGRPKEKLVLEKATIEIE